MELVPEAVSKHQLYCRCSCREIECRMFFICVQYSPDLHVQPAHVTSSFTLMQWLQVVAAQQYVQHSQLTPEQLSIAEVITGETAPQQSLDTWTVISCWTPHTLQLAECMQATSLRCQTHHSMMWGMITRKLCKQEQSGIGCMSLQVVLYNLHADASMCCRDFCCVAAWCMIACKQILGAVA